MGREKVGFCWGVMHRKLHTKGSFNQDGEKDMPEPSRASQVTKERKNEAQSVDLG